MNKKSLTLLGLIFAVAATACLTCQTAAAEKLRFTITVHVYDYADVSDKTLATAMDEGSRIFKYAGLNIRWVNQRADGVNRQDPEDSNQPWDRTHFVVRMLKHPRRGLGQLALGEALSFRIANIFLDRVTLQSAAGDLSAGTVLGHAIAHELGHLLLGDSSHGSSGIMVARW